MENKKLQELMALEGVMLCHNTDSESQNRAKGPP